MDGAGRFGDRSAIGERFDEVALLGIGPAVAARFAADGDPLIVGGIIAVGVEIRRLGRNGQVRGVERRDGRGRMLRELGVVAHGRDGNILGTCRTGGFGTIDNPRALPTAASTSYLLTKGGYNV